MTVHIGELVTEVTTSSTSAPAEPTAGPAAAESADARIRAEWVALRVRAEGFDD